MGRHPREITVLMPSEAGYNCTYDLVSSGSEEDTHAWLKFYADEEDRQQWAKDFPEDVRPRRTTGTGICPSIRTIQAFSPRKLVNLSTGITVGRKELGHDRGNANAGAIIGWR